MSSPSPPTIRPASTADAAGIAHVHVSSWRDAYAHRLPAETLAGLDEGARAERWRAIIDEGRTDVFIASLDGVVVGWASASDGRDESAPAPRELEGIYILRSAYGTGVGASLLEAAIGDADAYLWILDDNARAEAFYRKHGFERDGAVREHMLAGVPVPTARMVRG